MHALDALRPYRPVLYVLAVLGLFGINGVFLYNALLRPDVMAAATENPISLVFQIEAFLMVGFVAWLIALYGFKKPGWLAFVVLSIVGSLAFSVPAFLLMHLRDHEVPSGKG